MDSLCLYVFIIETRHSPEGTPPRWFGAGENLGLFPDIPFENEILTCMICQANHVRRKCRRFAPQNDI